MKRQSYALNLRRQAAIVAFGPSCRLGDAARSRHIALEQGQDDLHLTRDPRICICHPLNAAQDGLQLTLVAEFGQLACETALIEFKAQYDRNDLFGPKQWRATADNGVENARLSRKEPWLSHAIGKGGT